MASNWFTSTTGSCDIRVIHSNRHGTMIDYRANTRIGTVSDPPAYLLNAIQEGKMICGQYFDGHQFTPCPPLWE